MTLFDYMKIGIISPSVIPVPPPFYGGTELVVYNLVEGLSLLGEEVILFARNDSKVSCELVPYWEVAADFGIFSPPDTKAMVDELATKYAYASCHNRGVDIINDHTLSIMPSDIPVVHTLHGPAEDFLVEKVAALSERGHGFIFISNRQKELYLNKNKNINVAGVVHNSVDVKAFPWKDKKDDFFLFMGRANWEKGLDLAIRVASRAKMPLVMAIKMSEDVEKEFFRKEIQPWIDGWPKDVPFELHEEITREKKIDLYCRAKCTLFTSQWEEPFGLVMIESMACGTPVVALRKGAAPEVIVDGKTGFIVDSEEDMVDALKDVGRIDPKACREHVEKNFSLENKAADYLNIYKNFTASH